MVITFAVSSSPRPIGGVTVLYEFANALSRRSHEVRIVHAPFFGVQIDSLDDISWFRFEPGIEHILAASDRPEFPPADVIFGTGAPLAAGLPVHLVQGAEMMVPTLEREALLTPALKVCVATWLTGSGERFGIAPQQFNVVYMGIDHARYRVNTADHERHTHVAMLHHAHPAKGSARGLAALEEVRARVPDLRVELFGTTEPRSALPNWATFSLDPKGDQLAALYNRSLVFLQPSDHEGFGLTAVEAMACGCALVTTDNGGSRDYAVPGRTALVAQPRDVQGLADGITRLLLDDRERTRLADAGRCRALEFDWEHSGLAMEQLLQRYLADPTPFRRVPT